MAQDLGINHLCEFIGYTDDVKHFLSKSDLFVYPSEREGNPLALIEALVVGLPVVVSDIDCHTELFNEDYEIFFVTHNIESLSEQVDYFCKNPKAYIKKNSIPRKLLEGYHPNEYVKKLNMSLTLK